MDEIRSEAYVLNKFEGTVSAVDMVTDKEVARANFFDPTPGDQGGPEAPVQHPSRQR
ncbi:MAG: hypothetical protein IPO90_10775 [Flavobacteriales bacterium]|nr:hypothetical protein [Flavobacteriales bacterium]